jgi:IS5 family transposase
VAIDMQWRAIISFHFTKTYVHEITQLEYLLEPLWDLGNVYADSGYLSAENCRIIVRKGGTPFIRPKCNSTGWKPGKKIMYGNPYYDMMEQYKKDPKTWMKQYHQRSVIEAVFSGLKRRLGGTVASIKRSVQQVEIALKIILYNLMMLVRKRVQEEYF